MLNCADAQYLPAAARLKNFSGSVNLVLDTQGWSGLLIAAGSVDATDNYVLPIRLQRISPSGGKSLSYWTVANGYDTMVFLWNPTDAAQDLIFKVMFAGGHYNLPVHLGPKATQKVNLAQVVHSDVPDAEGHVIPAGVQAGSAKIVGSKAEDQSIEVAMTSGIFNASTGTCYQQCITCDGVTVYSVSADPFGVAVNGQTH